MKIYFSGIGGVAIGPLAEIARDAGYELVGSDLHASLITEQLQHKNISVHIGPQDGEFLRTEHAKSPIDYFVYTAALPYDHPELTQARELGIRTMKRDGLLSKIIADKDLELIAVAGTHGKTSTTGLLVWCFRQLNIPISYSVGTTLSFAPSGAFDSASRFFVYECDEYDRNFLHFTPGYSLITSIDYDHPDTYPTLDSYKQAFTAFIDQSDSTLIWQKDYEALDDPDFASDTEVLDSHIALDHIHLNGLHLRQNAFLVERIIRKLFPDINYHELIAAINSFPGTGRRMEKLAENIYSDYGHHPREITATLQAAREINPHVILVYQPHQNTRQHEIASEYTDDVFQNAAEIYWLATYLTRENPDLAILTPAQLTQNIHRTPVTFSELDDALWAQIRHHSAVGHLVLCMGAGTIDEWLREQLA